MSASKGQRGFVQGIFALLGSYSLCCWMLIGLFLLTLLGTLYQVDHGLYEAQKLYFNSWYVLEKWGPVTLPLPGAVLLMTILSVNLFVGGFVRIRKAKRTVGILIIHGGIAFLLLAGLVKFMQAEEGYVRLYEGDRASDFVSFNEWEVCVRELLANPGGDALGNGDEWHVRESEFRDVGADTVTLLTSGDLPFDVHLRHFIRHANVLPKGPNWSSGYPVVDGFGVLPLKPQPEEEFNTAVVYADIVPKGAIAGVQGEQAILWANERFPYVTTKGGRMFAIELRRERNPLPFDLEQVKFTKEEHPRTDIPSEFSSKVKRRNKDGSEPTEINISMNEPLREGGLVAFQTSYGPKGAKDGDRIFSVFSIVRNPSDRWPEYSCWVIGLGMLIAFGQRLMGYLKKQSKVRKLEVAS